MNSWITKLKGSLNRFLFHASFFWLQGHYPRNRVQRFKKYAVGWKTYAISTVRGRVRLKEEVGKMPEEELFGNGILPWLNTFMTLMRLCFHLLTRFSLYFHLLKLNSLTRTTRTDGMRRDGEMTPLDPGESEKTNSKFVSFIERRRDQNTLRNWDSMSRKTIDWLKFYQNGAYNAAFLIYEIEPLCTPPWRCDSCPTGGSGWWRCGMKSWIFTFDSWAGLFCWLFNCGVDCQLWTE